MNARPFLRWSFALSAFVALAATVTSCGPTEAPKCGPDTCATGCCLSDTECVPLKDQSQATCGRGGAVCRACLPGQTCGTAGCVNAGDGGVATCGPDNCAGCCAEDGQCVATSLQDDLRCGVGGARCGACRSKPDAGPSECGKLDQPCCNVAPGTGTGCLLGLECHAGICEPPGQSDGGMGGDAGTPADAGSKAALGEPCSANAQCATGFCQQLGFNGGYCTQSCQSAADCPSGSTCGSDPNGAASSICLKTCSTAGGTSGCRAGYVCEKRATTTGVAACAPGCNSIATCGSAPTCDSRGFCCGSEGFACCEGQGCGSGLQCSSGYCTRCGTANGPCCAGNTCDNGLTCSGGVCGKSPLGGSCAQDSACQSGICAEQAQGGTPGCATGPCWPGGYCIADCTSSSCPGGSSCTQYLAANPICVVNCPSPGSQSTCRSGYVCDKGWIDANPNQGVCLDACNSDADCNSASLRCNNGFCCGKAGYRCCAGNTCPFSGTCQNDGYCG